MRNSFITGNMSTALSVLGFLDSENWYKATA